MKPAQRYITAQPPTATEIRGLNARLEILKDQHAILQVAAERLLRDVEDAERRGRVLDAELAKAAECTCETTGFCWVCREVE